MTYLAGERGRPAPRKPPPKKSQRQAYQDLPLAGRQAQSRSVGVLSPSYARTIAQVHRERQRATQDVKAATNVLQQRTPPRFVSQEGVDRVRRGIEILRKQQEAAQRKNLAATILSTGQAISRQPQLQKPREPGGGTATILGQVPLAGGVLKAGEQFLTEGAGPIGTFLTHKAVPALASVVPKEGLGVGISPRKTVTDLANATVGAPAAIYQLGASGAEAALSAATKGIDLPLLKTPYSKGFNVHLQAPILPVSKAVTGKEQTFGGYQRAEQLWKSQKEDTVLGNLLQGKTHKAKQLAEKHPGLAALEGLGVYGAAGRTIGAGARFATRDAIGSTERASLQLLGQQRVPREYSSNIFTQIGQKKWNAWREAKAVDLYHQAHQLKFQAHDLRKAGDNAKALDVEKQASQVLAQARRVNPNRATGRVLGLAKDVERQGQARIQRNVLKAEHGRLALLKSPDYRAARMELLKASARVGVPRPGTLRVREKKRLQQLAYMHESVRREARDVERTFLDQIAPNIGPISKLRGKGFQFDDVIGAIARGYVRSPHTIREDLAHYRSYLQEIRDSEKADGTLEPHHETALNEQMGKIDTALAHPDLVKQAPKLFDTVDAYKTRMGEIEQQKLKAGLMDEDQLAAKFLPAMMVRLGVTKIGEGGQTRFATPEFEAWKKQRTEVGKLQKTFDETRDALVGKAATAAETTHLGSLHSALEEARASLEASKPKVTHVERQFLDAEGKPITLAEGGKRLAEQGEYTPAFVTASERKLGKGAFFQPASKRPPGEIYSRTGQSTKYGTEDLSYEAMRRTAIGGVTAIKTAQHFDNLVRDMGVGVFHGANKRSVDAAVKKANAAYPELGPFVAISTAPFVKSAERLEAIAGSLQDSNWDARVGQTIAEAISEAEKGGRGPVAVVPAYVVDNWRHLAAGPWSNVPFSRALRFVTQNFRQTVLPFSTRWFAGNVIEAAGRSMAASHSYGDMVLGFKTLDTLRRMELDGKVPQGTYDRFVGMTLGGRHMGSALAQDIHYAGPGVTKPLIRGMRALQHGALTLNRHGEDIFAAAGIGHQLRKDIRALSRENGHFFSKAADYLEEAVKNRATDTNKVIEMKTYLDRILGRYSAHSPSERMMIAHYTPFWDWYRNAVTFVLWQLPKNHPATTGLLASTLETLQKDLKDQGQVFDPSSKLPSYLKETVKTKSGDMAPLGHYMPFGAFGDLGGGLNDLLLPAVKAPLLNLAGKNWKLDELKNAQGDPANFLQRLAVAGESVAEAHVPLWSIAKRLREGGGSPLDTSTPFSPQVREGTRKGGIGAGALKVFNPFQPIPPGNKQRRRRKLSIESITDDALGTGRGRSDPVERALSQAAGGL